MSQEYKTSVSLSTKSPGVASVTLGLSGTSDPSEARYWAQTFGLGGFGRSSSAKRSYTSLTLPPVSSHAMPVAQVVFGPRLYHARRGATLAVATGPRVSLYGPALLTTTTTPSQTTTTGSNSNNNVIVTSPDRKVGTGGHPALCASFRSDGRLLAVGDDRGEVRVCDTTSRATLCTFASPTPTAVRAVAWLRNGKHLLSGGDDATLKLWSLTDGGGGGSTTITTNKEALWTLAGHGDSIRCLAVWQPRNHTTKHQETTTLSRPDLAMTGSYDHTIRIWTISSTLHDEDSDRTPKDGTMDRCRAILHHGLPVESLLIMPHPHPQEGEESCWLISAGGTVLKVWNPWTGKCVCTLHTQHSKTITSMVAMTRTVTSTTTSSSSSSTSGKDSNNVSWRILTAGLDGLVRVHTWDGFTGQVQHIHGVKLPDPITAMAVSGDGRGDRLALGTSTGHVFVRQKSNARALKNKRKQEPRAGTYAYFTRGQNASSASATDHVLSSMQNDRKRKLTAFDLALKRFRYGDALDEALDTRQPQAVMAVLEELGKRRGLATALSNRDEETLEPILSFTVRYITRPHFSSLLIGVAHMLCDIYGDVAGQSETIDELFDKLRRQVYNECRTQRSLLRIVGQLDGLLTAAEMEEMD